MGFGGENAASARPAPVGVPLALCAAVVGFCVTMLNHLIQQESCGGNGAKASIKCDFITLFGNAGFGAGDSRTEKGNQETRTKAQTRRHLNILAGI
jgi:hypothetical protein